jgi:hypothetical protein
MLRFLCIRSGLSFRALQHEWEALLVEPSTHQALAYSTNTASAYLLLECWRLVHVAKLPLPFLLFSSTRQAIVHRVDARLLEVSVLLGKLSALHLIEALERRLPKVNRLPRWPSRRKQAKP